MKPLTNDQLQVFGKELSGDARKVMRRGSQCGSLHAAKCSIERAIGQRVCISSGAVSSDWLSTPQREMNI